MMSLLLFKPSERGFHSEVIIILFVTTDCEKQPPHRLVFIESIYKCPPAARVIMPYGKLDVFYEFIV